MVTRAKRKILLFTSLSPKDIKLTEESSRGVRAFRSYIEYAEHGKFPDYGQVTDREPDSDFEITVSRILNQSGYKTVPQVGVAGFFIDIGVVHPQRENEYILGIECDGASYHSARSVRDRDRLRQEILESKLWTIHRIWSTDWFKNQEQETQRLLNVLNEIIERETSHASIENLSETETSEIFDETQEEGSEDWAEIARDELREKLISLRTDIIEKRFPDPSKGNFERGNVGLFYVKKTH